MTGSLAVRAGLAADLATRACLSAAVRCIPQSPVAWTLTTVQPSVWGVAAATAQLLIEGWLLPHTEATPRSNARSSWVLGLASMGGDMSSVFDGVADLLRSGLESLVLFATVSLAWSLVRSLARSLVRRSRQTPRSCDAVRSLIQEDVAQVMALRTITTPELAPFVASGPRNWFTLGAAASVPSVRG